MCSLDQENQSPRELVRNANSQVEPQTPESGTLGVGPSVQSVEQPSRWVCFVLGLEKPGSRAFHTPLPGTCFSWFLQDSSPFRSGFNLTCSLSLHTIHFPTACVTTGDYR